LIYGGIFIGGDLWLTWGMRHGLPVYQNFAERMLMVVIACFVTTGVHELGHALTAMALDMKVRRLTIGAFDWRLRQGRWQCRFSPAALLSAGGAMCATPVTMDEYRWRQICVCAAGPLASLFLGVLTFAAAVGAKDTAWGPAWKLLSCISTYSLLGFVVNLIPMQPGSLYSDGAKIYQLLAAGPASQVEHAFAMMSTSLVSPLRPRDMDIRLIEQAAGYCSGHRALLLKLNAFQHFFDAGRLPEAETALAEAEAMYASSSKTFPADLRIIVHDAFTFAHAFVRRDAAAARAWWVRTTVKRADGFTVDAWKAWCSLSWIENRDAEAREAWAQGNALAQKNPRAGAYDFDRDCFAMLRNELKAVAA
jgi:Zn-dependent protease